MLSSAGRVMPPVRACPICHGLAGLSARLVTAGMIMFLVIAEQLLCSL